MTKQDIHDIIQLLEAHFESIGQEVRNSLTFKFLNSQGDFLSYDNEYLFTQSFDDEEGYYAGEEKVESIKSNLVISYNSVYNWHVKEVEKQLEEEVKKANFNLKTFKYLSQEFKVLSFDEADEECFFIIQDSEFNENHQPSDSEESEDDFLDDDDVHDDLHLSYGDDEIEERIQLKKFNQFK